MRRRARAVALSALAAVLAASIAHRFAPPPSAEVARGGEEAFAEGLQPREFDAGGIPRRWTGRRLHLRFRNLPQSPATLQVAIRGHRSPVAIAADGVVIGILQPDQTSVELRLPPPAERRLEVILSTAPFTAEDGRSLGLMLDRAAVVPDRHDPVPLRLLASFLLPAIAMALAALVADATVTAGALVGAATTALQALAIWPAGLLRSVYADRIAVFLLIGAVLAAGFARWQGARRPGSAAWAFIAILSAFWVQGVAATHPLMVVGDAQFHVHKLYDVSRGDFFPTSETQHGRPFRFPYGVSFYALLAPLVRWHVDGVAIVRFGAAASGLIASAALYLLLAPHSPARAALAVMVLQALPITFDVYSYGNLSNVFGQAVTVLFFAWWERSERWLLGALLLFLGCLAHFSSLIVLVALVAALLIAARRDPKRDRRLMTAGVGLALAGAYYIHFWDLIVSQAPRLLEGGGQGRGVSRGALDAARLQVIGAVEQWGLPAMVLAWFGRPRPAEGTFTRDLVAFWAVGAVLAVLAVVTPLDVRYLYALTLPLSIAAAAGFTALAGGFRGGRLLAGLLLAAQLVWAVARALDALLWRYRP